ncbi:MAG: hypothetical protein KF785_07770 [Gemmatimonadales bacterium]|nr:hypothetical protein [Gemmatimonadales bacterium]
MLRQLIRVVVVFLVVSLQAPALRAQPAAQLASLFKQYLGLGLPADWRGIEGLSGVSWAPLPPTSLQNCLPNGDCYARQGTVTIDGARLAVVASGARTMVMTLFVRAASGGVGDSAMVLGLREAGIAAALARCPVREGVGGTRWYRLTGGAEAGFLSIQPPGPGRPGAGYILTFGDELPSLQPNQLAAYTEQCGPGETRAPVSTVLPHQRLAVMLVQFLVPASGAPLYDWKTLRELPTEISWNAETPVAANLSALGDPNPMMLSGNVAYAGRKFSVRASGTATQVKLVAFDEQGLHPKGEHLLGVVYEQGIAVRLVRCGPIYTEATNNWYSLISARTRPAHVRQSIRYEGNLVQDSYELRLDGSLPPRDPRDRNPGTNGC